MPFLGFWRNFLIGDDWWKALIAIVGFVLTYALRRSQVFAWWVLPVLVILSVTHSLQHRVRYQKVWLAYPYQGGAPTCRAMSPVVGSLLLPVVWPQTTAGEARGPLLRGDGESCGGYPNSRYRSEETMEGFERVVVCGVSFDLAYVLRVEDPARVPPPDSHRFPADSRLSLE